MRKVTSREYKLMLDPGRFLDRRLAVSAFLDELKQAAKACGVKTKGRFDKLVERTITFLDTDDFALRSSGVVLRRRSEAQGAHRYTLKRRTPDRYLADAIDLSAADGLDENDKFEEDVGHPFVSRFSHSNTITLARGEAAIVPRTLAQAADLFPCLVELRHDGRRLGRKTPLSTVNGVRACEQVASGPVFVLDDTRKVGRAEVAVILWSDEPDGQVRVAEFSFRYQNKKEKFPAHVAQSAMDLFEAIAGLDWCHPGAMTKTEYVYQSGGVAVE